MKKIIMIQLSMLAVLAVGVYFFLSFSVMNLEKKETKSSNEPSLGSIISLPAEVPEIEKIDLVMDANGHPSLECESENLTIESWKLGKDEAGASILTLGFDFKNKSNRAINLSQFIGERVSVGQLRDGKDYEKLAVKFVDEAIIIEPKQSYKGVLQSTLVEEKLSPDRSQNSVIVGVSSESSGWGYDSKETSLRFDKDGKQVSLAGN